MKYLTIPLLSLPEFRDYLNDPEVQEIIREQVRNVISEKKQSLEIQFPEILNVEQAAKFLNRSVDSIYKLTSKKLIPHYNPSGKLLIFKQSELIEWLEKGKVKTYDELKAESENKFKNIRRR